MDAAASVGGIFYHVWLLVFCCEKEVPWCVVHTDMVDGDGEGEPMLRLKTELEGHDGWVFVEERSVTWPEVVKGEKLLPNLLQWDLPFRNTCDGERCCSKN